MRNLYSNWGMRRTGVSLLKKLSNLGSVQIEIKVKKKEEESRRESKPMNLNTITHIHLQRNIQEDMIDVFLVDNTTSTQERISLRYSEMKHPTKLSPAITFVRTDMVALLQQAGIVDTPSVESDTGYTTLVLTSNIHNYLKTVNQLFLELIQKEVAK